MEFIDLASQQELIRERIDANVRQVMAHGQYIMGPEVGELEGRLAARVGARHCVSCASGTDALLLSLMALGVRPGDAVFTPAFTFVAAAESIALLGATPVFVDVDQATFNLDSGNLKRRIAQCREGVILGRDGEILRPSGIVAVDLFGLPAEYDQIDLIASEEGLWLVEDAAQSFGASIGGRAAGRFGHIATTSFFPAKPLGCYGDGGALFTDDDELAEVLYSLRLHGKGRHKYDNVRVGLNSRLDTMQAAILLAKLEVFTEEMNQRQLVADRYASRLNGRITAQRIPEGFRSAWAQYAVVVEQRERVASRLSERGVPTAVYYSVPLPRLGAFVGMARADLQIAGSDELARTVLCLPMHPYLTEGEQERVATALLDAVEKERA